MNATVAATAGDTCARPIVAPPLPLPGQLSRQTINSLARYFATKGHRPSDDMWRALVDLAVTLEDMAVGKAPAKFFLSSLDPGVGKTQTITHFVDALLSAPSCENVGVIMCVGRLSEVKTMIANMGVPSDNLAVLTSDATLNALGKASGCTAEEVFEEVATLFLFTLRDPRRLQRHTREHHFQTARMVLNLRPRFTKSFISGNTGRKYSTANRLSSEVLDKFGTFINVQLIGSLCAMTESFEFNRKREERFKRELASTIAAQPFAVEPAHA
jgi:hypothetical protein